MGTCQVTSEETGEVFTLFFTIASPFSNFHPCQFTAKANDGSEHEYCCVEQFYMYNKALSANDYEIAQRILDQNNPRAMKKLGGEINGFQQKIWNEQSKDVMCRALNAKFAQNEELRKLIFLTHGSTLVECSPSDPIWGIGLSMDMPEAREKRLWRGKNQLGKIMTSVRDFLYEQEQFGLERTFAESARTRHGYFKLYFSNAKARQSFGGGYVARSLENVVENNRKRRRETMYVPDAKRARLDLEVEVEVRNGHKDIIDMEVDRDHTRSKSRDSRPRERSKSVSDRSHHRRSKRKSKSSRQSKNHRRSRSVSKNSRKRHASENSDNSKRRRSKREAEKENTKRRSRSPETDDDFDPKQLPNKFMKGNSRQFCEDEWAKKHDSKYEDLVQRRLRKLRHNRRSSVNEIS